MKLCIRCGNEQTSLSSNSHGTQKYCSRKCYFDAKFGKRSEKISCSCGKEIVRYPSYPNRKYCSRQCYYDAPKSDEFKKKISDAFRGENHPNWKGGIMKGRKDRNLMEYKNWRFAVFSRDKFTCVWCGAKNHKGLGKTVRLEADHLKSWSDYPELRYELSNGRTLCKDCHSKRTAQQHKERMNYVA